MENKPTKEELAREYVQMCADRWPDFKTRPDDVRNFKLGFEAGYNSGVEACIDALGNSEEIEYLALKAVIPFLRERFSVK